jgi:hypothetical protein
MCGKYLVYREKIGDPPRSPTIFGKNINIEPSLTGPHQTLLIRCPF